ncbi:HAMP domain-containing histidine kinase [Microbacterium paludicola]|uniref:Sensor histidine kinase MtrB n=1 Tax=Microbacterium paludicola TaxID=300019 RepID=A0A4Y9FY95_9MICO|nr:MtrAB system histidine kinase MtrB [Microbacterium paludicola]MBF0815179.1 HAMP domain-containing histidine kinase [Microbacterium paludicola]TFU34437.1 HAMP domain-containing histidine kinase [Microbacterium paludicola]
MSTAATPALFGWTSPRSWPRMLLLLWGRSLQFRTILITTVLTAITIAIACLWMALAIQNNLFQSRVDEVQADARRAVDEAQRNLDASEVAGSRAQMQQLWNLVLNDTRRLASTDQIAGFRIEKDPVPLAPADFGFGGLTAEAVSPGLRERVQSQAGFQWWQSIALTDAQGREVPGIIVGQQLRVPSVGAYEIYLAYDLQEEAETLGFVQGTLWGSGIAMVLIVVAILWLVMRALVAPIVEASGTSARLASGDLKVRIPVRGEDELATLGRSFNAMADSIESQIQELAELSLVQQRFVSDVSHELRTPLTTIRLAADILHDRRDEFDSSTARAAELLHTQVARFEELLTDLLEISRYDAGSVQLELEATSLAHLAEDVLESMRQVAEQHGTELRFVAPGGYSPVDMDPRRVRRILRNLLGNAIEHGEGRPIVVTVDSNPSAVAVGVRDYGMGMSPEAAERVFDRFWRADPSRKRTLGGTGLGLSIALGDARLHGGTLAVWSQLGGGTNFVLTLPRKPHDPASPLAELESPLPLEPSDESLHAALGLTQPILTLDVAETHELSDVGEVRDLRDVDGLSGRHTEDRRGDGHRGDGHRGDARHGEKGEPR